MEIKQISISKVRMNPKQPRETFDKEKIKELANSIKESDLLQPIVVRKHKGNYQIIAGERRYRAFNMLNKKRIPAIVWKIDDDIEVLEKSLIENLQREDLTSTERENAITELWETGKYESKADLARKIGINDATVTENIISKGDRTSLSLGPSIKTSSIIETRSLPDYQRKQVLRRVERGHLAVRGVRDEVRYIKFKKTIKQEVEIPIELRGSQFVTEFSRRCADLAVWFNECNRYPFERLLTKTQLKRMGNVLTDLLNKGDKLDEKIKSFT